MFKSRGLGQRLQGLTARGGWGARTVCPSRVPGTPFDTDRGRFGADRVSLRLKCKWDDWRDDWDDPDDGLILLGRDNFMHRPAPSTGGRSTLACA